MNTIAVLRKVEIKNYKNIASAVVSLHPFSVLVGTNGAGKSNFVDALTFVADCLSERVSTAFQKRGGIAAVRRKSNGHPYHIGIRLHIDFPDGSHADYSFDIAARRNEGFSITQERCIFQPLQGPRHEFTFKDGFYDRGTIEDRDEFLEIGPERLALSFFPLFPEFRAVYDFLTGAHLYNIRPEILRSLQDPDPAGGKILSADGSNAASVLRRIIRDDEHAYLYDRIRSLLSKVVPGTTSVRVKSYGQNETLEFSQDVGTSHAWSFDAINMSDGTLRILGILLAIYQPTPSSLLAIEEPEGTIHPGAADVLMDILLDGSNRSQVIVTTHSPDILDNRKVQDEQILIVHSVDGNAQISPIKDSTRELLREHLFTAGELLRRDELEIDTDYVENHQPRIFGALEPPIDTR